MPETCHLKVLWLSVETPKMDFQIEIIGKNLTSCINSKEALMKNFVIEFTVLQFQHLPLFTGNFSKLAN